MAVASTALVTLPSVAIGIIAFGSLLTDAGRELDAVTERLEPGLTTPFAVEFAHSSTTRDGAPTLVPFPTGGPVRCAVIVLRESVGREEAYDLLFRRELHQVGSTESYWSRRRGWIHEEPSFGTVELALYTALRANIEPLTVARLVELAIGSACAGAGADGRDGISYLRSALARGITTPLSGAYERELLLTLSCASLDDAVLAARGGRYTGSVAAPRGGFERRACRGVPLGDR